MAVNDLVSDMLTRIRNAVRNKERQVNILNSKLCAGIAQVMQNEGFIESFDRIEDGRQGLLRLNIKYGDRGEVIINNIQRVSRPSCRVYRKVGDLPRPLEGLGIAIVSTSQGVLSDRQAREKKVGGELLCVIE
jgi:small subunit ribosomal protein S8